jgi:hypothetical protein
MGPNVASIKNGEISLLYVEQIEEFVAFMGAHAIVTLMNGKYETCDEARK